MGYNRMYNMLIPYLFRTLLFHIFLFFKHWYSDALFLIYGVFLHAVRVFEKRLALRVNLHFLFKPLYQEYNIVGYVVGFLFRGLRIIFAGLVYCVLTVLALAAYVAWAAIPVVLVSQIVIHLR